MSRNAIAAMAVIFVSGFAGCAATARATEPSTDALVVAQAPAVIRHVASLHDAAPVSPSPAVTTRTDRRAHRTP